MYLTERHVIKESDPLHKELDNICFLTKNLYNKGLYIVRQHYFETKEYLNYFKLNRILIDSKDVDYYSMNTKVSNQTLRLLDNNFKSFFSLIKKKNSNNYDKPIKIPKYLDKEGRFIAIYEKHAISRTFLKKGEIKLSNISSTIPTKKATVDNIVEVRVLPRKNHLIVEVVYKEEEKPLSDNNERYASIDLGLNNLATVSSNVTKPFIINGRPLKSINQRWNKQRSKLQSSLKGNKKTSKQITLITNKRNNRINTYLHKSSRKIVDFLVSNKINTLVIGYNKQWKQDINMGKKNNQSFVNVPFYTFIKQLEYKCKLEGINVILTEESYTSKCSFIDNEPLEKKDTYLGKRIKRGLFKSKEGKLINADLNGSLNILRKVIGEFHYPKEACCTPVQITPPFN